MNWSFSLHPGVVTATRPGYGLIAKGLTTSKLTSKVQPRPIAFGGKRVVGACRTCLSARRKSPAMLRPLTLARSASVRWTDLRTQSLQMLANRAGIRQDEHDQKVAFPGPA